MGVTDARFAFHAIVQNARRLIAGKAKVRIVGNGSYEPDSKMVNAKLRVK